MKLSSDEDEVRIIGKWKLKAIDFHPIRQGVGKGRKQARPAGKPGQEGAVIGSKEGYDHHPKQRVDFDEEDVRQLSDAFEEKNRYLCSVMQELTLSEYLRNLFPEGSFEVAGSRGADEERRPNGIPSVLKDEEQRGCSYNRILFDDFGILPSVLGKKFVILAPVGYSGRRRLEKFAYQIFGIVIDLDYFIYSGSLPSHTRLFRYKCTLLWMWFLENPSCDID